MADKKEVERLVHAAHYGNFIRGNYNFICSRWHASIENALAKHICRGDTWEQAKAEKIMTRLAGECGRWANGRLPPMTERREAGRQLAKMFVQKVKDFDVHPGGSTVGAPWRETLSKPRCVPRTRDQIERALVDMDQAMAKTNPTRTAKIARLAERTRKLKEAHEKSAATGHVLGGTKISRRR